MTIKNMSGVFIFYGNNVLMLKRTKKDFNGEGQYYSIGGKFENEDLNSPTKCILRELNEETGLKEDDISNLQLKYIVYRNRGDIITQNYLFFAELKKMKELTSCNEGILEWVPIEEVFNKPQPESSLSCLNHYFNGGKDINTITVAVGTNVNGYGEYFFTDLVPFEEMNNSDNNKKK